MSNRPLAVLALALISLVVAMAFGAFGTYFGQPGMPEDAVTYAEWARRDAPAFLPVPESTPVPQAPIVKAPEAVEPIYPEPSVLQQPATGVELELVDGRTGEAAGGAIVDLLPFPEESSSFSTYYMVKDGQVPTP